MTKPSASQPSRVFITGGASGFGRALAARWAKAGARVAIGDKDPARGEEAASALGARFVPCDVTRAEDLEGAARSLVDDWGGVDVVVNNAGVASGGALDDVPLEEWRRVIDVNLMGVVHGCKAFVPIFKRQRAGHLVNVASMAGLVHLPFMATYNATKAAVVALSETLQTELAADGIKVSVVCPSFFKTDLAKSLAETSAPDVVAMTERMVTGSSVSAELVAGRAFRAIERGDFLVLTHRDAAAAWLFKRLVPHAAFAGIVERASRRMKRGVAL